MMSKKKGTARGRLVTAQEKIAETAKAQRITEAEAVEQLAELARIRDQHASALEGTGMQVRDVRYDHVRNKVEVVVSAGEAPTGPGRIRVAELELERVRPQRTWLGRLLAMGAAGFDPVVAATAPSIPPEAPEEGSGGP